MNIQALLLLSSLLPIITAMSCYDGEFGTKRVTKGHKSCRLVFDLAYEQSFAQGYGESDESLYHNGWNEVSKCEPYKTMIICTCFSNHCNKPMTVKEFFENGFRFPFLTNNQY